MVEALTLCVKAVVLGRPKCNFVNDGRYETLRNNSSESKSLPSSVKCYVSLIHVL